MYQATYYHENQVQAKTRPNVVSNKSAGLFLIAVYFLKQAFASKQVDYQISCISSALSTHKCLGLSISKISPGSSLNDS